MNHAPFTNPPAAPPDPPSAPPRAMIAMRVDSCSEGESRERFDWLAIEEPLEIRAGGPKQDPASVVVTMRTPGHDRELAVGFLYTEGLIRSRAELASTGGPAEATGASTAFVNQNIEEVRLRAPFDGSALKRNFFATSSCGVCGKAVLDQVAVRGPRVGAGPVIARKTILGLPGALRSAQTVFDRTGGLHAAGLFDAAGRLLLLREDVGRHNAVDKLVGRALLDGGIPLADRIMLVSGRASFEIVQKGAVAGIPIICAVSAPSSLAVSTAERLGITLIGFLRGSSFNVYTRPERIDPER